MYIATWRMIGPAPKQRMISYLSKINGDGPTLLWFVLTLYHGTAAQIIRAQRKKIERFIKVMNSYKGDIEKVCEYFQNTTQSLFTDGGHR